MVDLGLIEPPPRPRPPRTTIRDGERPVRLALAVVAVSLLLDALPRLNLDPVHESPVVGAVLFAKSLVLAVSLGVLGHFARAPGAEERVDLLAIVIPGITILLWGFQSVAGLAYFALFVTSMLLH